jgi:hypothetical protein
MDRSDVNNSAALQRRQFVLDPSNRRAASYSGPYDGTLGPSTRGVAPLQTATESSPLWAPDAPNTPAALSSVSVPALGPVLVRTPASTARHALSARRAARIGGGAEAPSLPTPKFRYLPDS